MTELLAMLKNWRAAYALDKAERELFDRIEAALSPSPSISEGEVGAAAKPRSFWMHYDNQIGRWVVNDRPPQTVRSGAEVIHVCEVLPLAASKARATTEVEVGWQPIETARKQVDETVLLRIEHMNYAIASDDDKHRWEEVVTAYWTDFNAGGWVWHGLAGSPTHWREIPPPPRTP